MTKQRQRQIAQAIVAAVFTTLDDLVAENVRGQAYDRMTDAVLDAMDYQKAVFALAPKK